MADHRKSFEARDPFAAGTFPVCAATHDLGVRRLFDLATLVMLLDCRPGDRVLDLGAGSGFSTEMLARLGYDVIAVDPDWRALGHNRRRATVDAARIDGRCRVVQGDAERLPLADAAFDGALGMNVLHHLGNTQRALSELARVLKPGARAVFCEPGLDHLHETETKRAIEEHGEDDRAFDVVAMLRSALERGFSEAMLTATLPPALRLLPVQEIDVYLSGAHPRPHMTPAGVVEELHRRHAYAMIVKEGARPRTSRHPGALRCRMTAAAVPDVVAQGETVMVDVEAVNTGDTLWLAAPTRLGGFVTFGCKLVTEDGRLVSDALGRTFLSADVAPGEHASATMAISVPATVAAGRYLLKFDAIDELVCWFSDVDPEAGCVHALTVVAAAPSRGVPPAPASPAAGV